VGLIFKTEDFLSAKRENISGINIIKRELKNPATNFMEGSELQRISVEKTIIPKTPTTIKTMLNFDFIFQSFPLNF
jgi:hypothetical protein